MKEQKCAVLVKLPGDKEVYWNCERRPAVGDKVICNGQSGTVLEVIDWLDIQDFPCVDLEASSFQCEEFDPDDFEILGDTLYRYKGTDKRVQVPPYVKKININVFEGDFDEIIIPKGVESVSMRAFSDNTHIGSIVIYGDTVFEKDLYADDTKKSKKTKRATFNYNEKDGCLYFGCPEHPYLSLMGVSDPTLQEIVLHPECRSISGGAFDNAKEVKRIVIPDSVTRLAPKVLTFQNEEIELEIGAGLSMSEDDLSDVSRTAKITVSPKNHHIKQAEKNIITGNGHLIFGACNCIPKGVVSIESYAFRGAKNLGDIVLPDGLQSIAWFAFRYSDLTSISIPASLKGIHYTVFYETPKLTSVRFRGTRAQWKAAVGDGSIEKDVFCEKEPDSFLAMVTGYGLTVKFSDGKNYRFNCDFAVQIGDQVRVTGPYAGQVGTVVRIDEESWTNRSNTNRVTEVVR